MIKFVHMDLDTIGDVDEFLGPFWRRGEIAGDSEHGYDVILAEAAVIKTSQMMDSIKVSLGGLEIGIHNSDFERMEVI